VVIKDVGGNAAVAAAQILHEGMAGVMDRAER
jgi:hypothetical protein